MSQPKYTSFLPIAALLTILTACTTASLEELRRTDPTGDPFLVALAKEYLSFSESEAAQYDWRDSKYFADKGLSAAYGKTVTPEEPARWKIKGEALEELTTARALLVEAMTPEVIAEKPGLAARTQLFYDCWVEQQEENWQEADIASCRGGFVQSLAALKPDEPVIAEPEEPKDPLIFTSSYIVFFEWAKSVLTQEAGEVLDAVAADLKAEADYEVVLHGHADRSGDANFNLKLSQKRAEAVKAGLVKRGLKAEHIRYYAFGETDNRIPTPDKVREEANRRVEIFLDQ